MSGTLNGYLFPPPMPMTALPQTMARSHEHAPTPFWPNQGPNWSNQPYTNFHYNNNDGAMRPMPIQPSFNARGNGYNSNCNMSPYGGNQFPPFSQGGQKYFSNGRQRPFKQKVHHHGGLMQNKGVKQDKQAGPKNLENGSMVIFCEPCEKEFKTEQDKMAHLKQHSKCEVEDCNFIASRKALKLHFIQCHEVGKFKIVLKNDEDINKWREERKKNYPNVSRKKERLKEEKCRKIHGNVLKETQFSYKGKGSWKRRALNDSLSCKGKEEANNMELLLAECSTSRNDIIEIPIDSSGENKVDQPDRKNSKGEIDKPNGLASLKLMYDSNESENEDDTSPKEYKPTLSSLDGTSQSSEKDGILHDNVDKKAMIKDDVTEKTEIKNDHTKVQNGFAKGTNYENGRSNSEFHLRQSKHGSKELGNDRKRRLPDAKKHQQKDMASHASKKKKSRPTLLEMLLANDIKHERNVVLQCIRYITKNSL